MSIDNVMLYSGGLDSTVLLYKLKPNVKALLFNYGQRHKKELQNAGDICRDLDVAYNYVDLHDINFLIASGSQAGLAPVPEGHYAEESMKQTIVPNRNMIMISIAVGHAITIGAVNVWYAAHAGDHAIYPDCRPEFVEAMQHAIAIGNAWYPPTLNAPFINMTKAEIVALGSMFDVPFARTWSCYKGEALHCGRCGTCVERKEAFVLADVEDPTQYA
jgi:7-cyano-7-deazaguanine synthase